MVEMDQPLTVGEAWVDQWLSRLEYAKKAKQYFDEVGDQCYKFYRSSAKFMWEPEFRNKFIGNDISPPQFAVTINKAWEYVSIFGPYLFWDYAHRGCTSYEPLFIDEELFGDHPLYPHLVQKQQFDKRVAQQRCATMDRYLNYSQREQPLGLHTHSMLALYDALIRGRGVLVPRAYQNPGSARVLTGLFYEPVANFFVDPDCTDPLLETATWIAIKHISPSYELEDRFNLPRGTLNDAAQLETAESLVMNNRPMDQVHRRQGRTNDLIVWYEIWSKCGVAGRSVNEKLPSIDAAVGDYAYLCIAPGMPWPLNAPPVALEDADEDDIAELLSWPLPSQIEGRWPVALLDFNYDPESCWPLAPLSGGLGALICMNVLMSAIVEQAYENRKSIIASLGGALKDVERALHSAKSPALVELKEGVADDIGKVIQYLNRPGMNTDILTAFQYVEQIFEKATGLIEFMYGTQQKVTRVARDIAAKEEKAAIRPEKMGKDVTAWQTGGARLEAFLAVMELEGADVDPYIPAVLWDELIANQDPELLMREMDFVIEATQLQRPNRERDLANLQTLAQQVLPIYLEYARDTGDTQQANHFIEATFKALQQPFEGLRMGPWTPPPPSPESQQQMQLEAEAQQAEFQADLAKAEAEIEGKQVDAQRKQLELGFEQADRRQALQYDVVKFAQDILQSREKHTLGLRQSAQEHEQEMQQSAAEGGQKIRLMRAQARAKPKANGSAKT